MWMETFTGCMTAVHPGCCGWTFVFITLLSPWDACLTCVVFGSRCVYAGTRCPSNLLTGTTLLLMMLLVTDVYFSCSSGPNIALDFISYRGMYGE